MAPPRWLPHWLPHFTGASCDDAIARAKDLGGRALAGPIEFSQPGSIAVLRNPQGAVFAV